MKKNANRVIDFRYAPDINQTCIGFADDYYKTIVREDGSLNYLWEGDRNQFVDGTIPACEKRVLNLQEGNLGFKYRYLPRFYHRDTLTEKRQDFGDPRAAVVITREEYQGTSFQWTTFAHRDKNGARMDIILFRMEAKPGFGHAKSSVYLQELGEASDPPETVRPISSAYALPVGTPRIPAPIALYTPIYRGKSPLEKLVLQEGDVWEGAFGLVYHGTVDPEAFTLEYAEKALEAACEYWREIRPFRNAFHIPDPQIQGMLDACGRNILQAREIVEDICEFHVGPTIYRGLWVVDGYYFGECAYMMGRDEEGFQCLQAVLKRVKPDGSIRILPDHHKETAVALSTIVRQCELRNDDDRLREMWPVMLRGMEHLRRMRDDSFKLGKDYPAYGLFQPSFGDGGIYGPEPEYTTPMNVILGLSDAYRAGKRLKLPRYEEFGVFAQELMARMRECIERDRGTTPEGIPYVPLSMAENESYKPQTGCATIARVAFHGEFEPDDRIVTDLLRLIDACDDREEIPECTGWRSDQSIYTYSSVRFAQLLLQAGQREKAADYLYAFANHASASRVWREEQPVRETHSAEICGDMPHNWASVEFIRLVRNLVVLETFTGVELLPGLPEEWLPRAGDSLVLEKTPTRFGKLSLELSVRGKGGYLLSVAREDGNQQPQYLGLHWAGKAVLDGGELEKSNGKYLLPLEEKQVCIELF